MYRWLLFSLLLVALLPSRAARAQTPPGLEAALADLSARVGRTVTLADLQNWSFEVKVFPDASLGCPEPGQMYAQVLTSGTQFILAYQGTSYDYRVSADGRVVVLCTTAVAPTPDPRANCPPSGDPGYLPPRLSIGGQGRVAPGGFPNNIRSLPGSSGDKIGEIPPGGVFTVLDGPRCSTLDKIVWWQVRYNTTFGWTAEGQGGVYWLEPVDDQGVPLIPSPTPALAARPAIRAANAGQVVEIRAGQPLAAPAVLVGTNQWAFGTPTGQITLFDWLTGAPVASVSGHAGAVTALAASSPAEARRLLASGGADGMVRLWDISSGTAIAPGALLAGHTGAVTALAFNLDGSLVASGGEDRTVRLWDVQTGSALIVLTSHAAAVASLAFGPDDAALISTGDDGEVKVWGLPPTAG
mgnify:CR=1 FL=1